MTATFGQARTDILSTFRTTWEADTPAVVGSVPPVQYEGVPQTGVFPPKDGPWARAVIRHGLAVQATFVDGSRKRFEKFGIVTIQVFTALEDGRGLIDAQGLAEVAKKAFEGKQTVGTNIWFRNVRINEIGVDGPWFQMNVLAEFRYDEFA